VPFKEVDMREDLGVTPAPKLTAGALSAVPIVVGLWPVLLTGIYAMSKRKEKIVTEEMNLAVAAAVEQANAEANAKKKAEIEALNKMKKKEIDNAVKKALEEAAKPKAEDEGDAQPEKADKKPSEEGS
ncbi:MAG: hypothetical protein PVF29_18605, partial [Desulfobacterales bacterium]|jgi:biopolymer transport protein ExbB/TolQ